MICKNCRNEIEGETEICPFCGEDPEIEPINKKHRISYQAVIFLPLIVFLLCVCLYLYNLSSEREKQLTSGSSISLSSNISQTEQESDNSDPGIPASGITVFITPSGTKFHRADCEYVGEGALQIDSNEALLNGYLPCSICDPMNDGTSAIETTTSSATTTASTSVTTTASTTETTTQTTTEHRRLSENDIVYITKTGKKYHRADCAYIDADSCESLSVKAAVSRGLTECSVCHPGYYTGPTEPSRSETTTAGQTTSTTRASTTTRKAGQTSSTTSKSGEKSSSTTVNEAKCFINESGEYYHLSENCSILKQGSYIYRISFENAVKSEYLPCPNCAKK